VPEEVPVDANETSECEAVEKGDIPLVSGAYFINHAGQPAAAG